MYTSIVSYILKGAMRDPVGVAWDQFSEVKVFAFFSITVIILMTI